MSPSVVALTSFPKVRMNSPFSLNFETLLFENGPPASPT